MKKLLVFMIDALCSCDIEPMRSMPNFGPLIERGSYVHHMRPVHPALTYCCHASIVTGRYVDGHGITNNEFLRRGVVSSDVWFARKEEMTAPTILDFAREAGLTTCSLSWPITGGADYTYNFPMIVPYNYAGYEPEKYLRGAMTDNLMNAYFWKYGRYLGGPNRSLDTFTMCVAPDLIRDFGQPDLMFVKMCDLDSARHHFGVHHKKALDQLRSHDAELGVLLESIRRYGDLENTNIVIMGDHGQTDTEDVLNFNKLLEQNGFLTADASGNIVSWQACAHSAGLTCFIELADPNDAELKERVRAFLLSLTDDPEIRLAYVLDEKEMKEKYRLAGPFDFVIESRRNITFDFRNDMSVPSIWRSKIPGDHIIGIGAHGGSPEREEQTLFLAAGPSVKTGVVIESADLVDEAVTMARMCGFDMPGTDGRVLSEMLTDGGDL